MYASIEQIQITSESLLGVIYNDLLYSSLIIDSFSYLVYHVVTNIYSVFHCMENIYSRLSLYGKLNISWTSDISLILLTKSLSLCTCEFEQAGIVKKEHIKIHGFWAAGNLKVLSCIWLISSWVYICDCGISCGLVFSTVVMQYYGIYDMRYYGIYDIMWCLLQ